MDTPELQELVNAPRERLDVEYKAWLDLTDRETSAKLATHSVRTDDDGRPCGRRA